MSKKLGSSGEQLAREYLIDKGFRIIESNFFTRFGEIDIIAYRDKTYHFVEVKTRRSNQYGTALEAISNNKYRHMMKTIQIYLTRKDLHDNYISVDLICIDIGKNNKVEVEWVENITV